MEEKSPMAIWAENEVRLACQHENPNWDGKSFDYGCSCYTSALEAYKVLLKQGHSGYSWSVTTNILYRLMKNLPLMPITIQDFGYIPGVTPELKDEKTGAIKAFYRKPTPPSWSDEHGNDHYQCPRKSSLFLTVHPDKTYELGDNDMFVSVDIECYDDTFHSGVASRIAEEMFPIQFPYYPGEKPYFIYTRTFLTDPKNGDFDTVEICHIKTPDGKIVPVNRYFHEIDHKMTEITAEDYLEVSKKRIDTWERKASVHIANDIVESIFDEGEAYWTAVLEPDKWSPRYDDSDYEQKREYYQSYNYREIWWSLYRATNKSNSCNDILNNLEKQIALNKELREPGMSRWGTFRAIAKLDKELLNRYPSLQGIYDATEALIGWVKSKYAMALELSNNYIKELEAIEDLQKRIERRKEICKMIESPEFIWIK